MEEKAVVLYLFLVVAVAVAVSPAAAQGGAPVAAYVNHTVGDDAGWFFNNTNNQTSANFSAWAATQSFNLGDYLIFNTNTNQTVIQTYNETTFKNCNTDDALDSDTTHYGGGNTEFGQPLTVSIPLTREVPQYYFSSADDGTQCLNGLAFAISVGHGLGLPPSLNQPPPPPYVEPPSTVEEGQKTPETTIISSPPSGGVKIGAHLSWMVGLMMFLVV